MNRRILNLALPNILSNLTVPLLGAVDTALMGHLEEVYYLGAIAIAGIIFDFVYWGFGFLRMGTTGLTAQAYGNDNHNEISLLLIRALIISLSTGLVLIVSQTFIGELGFYLVEATPEVEEHAKIYFFIRIYAAPATLSLYVLQGWFLGMQNARFPLYITIAVNAFNIGFNLLFVKYYGMKADGIAWGTLIAQYGGVLFATFLFALKYRQYVQKYALRHILDKTALQNFFTVNRDIFIRTLCLIFTFSFFTAKGAEFGEVILAANTILMTLWMMLAYGVDGFAYAAESLVGNYVGKLSRKPELFDEYKKVIWLLFYWAAGLGALASVIYGFFGGSILRLFTDQAPVLEAAQIFMFWVIIAPVINSVCFIWDGIYIGATRTQAMRNAMLVCTFLVFLPLFYATKGILGNHGLWLSMLVFMIARGITLTWLAKKHIFEYPKIASA